MNANSVYKKIEIIGTSKESIEKATNHALSKASKSVRNMRWFEVNEIRGAVNDGKVNEWQVGLNVGFALDENSFSEESETQKVVADQAKEEVVRWS